MKRTVCTLLALCLLAGLLSGCAEELPPLPPPPGKETAEPVEQTPAPRSAPAEEPAPAPADPEPSFSGALELGYALPAVEDAPSQPPLCLSGPEAHDCAFRYSESCELWVNNEGVIRLEPRRYFARFFLSSVLRGGEDAPQELSDLLDTAKWNAAANEMTVGGKYAALRMSSWKYDTYRRWIVWETPERYYTLYVSCFDVNQKNVNAVLDTITESFRTGSDLVSASARPGETLCRDGAAELRYSGTVFSVFARNGTDVPRLRLLLDAENAAPELTDFRAEGYPLSLDSVSLFETESGQFCVEIPLFDENGKQFESLSLRLSPRALSAESLTITIKGSE